MKPTVSLDKLADILGTAPQLVTREMPMRDWGNCVVHGAYSPNA